MVRRFDLVGGKAVAEAAVLLCGATKEATPEGDCEAILVNPWVQEMVARSKTFLLEGERIREGM